MKNQILQLTPVFFLIPAAILALNGCSSPPKNQAESAPAVTNVIVLREGLKTYSTTGVVQSIDYAKQEMVLRFADGNFTTCKYGPEVRNADRIKRGDRVAATVSEEIGVFLVKGGLPAGSSLTNVIARAPKGGDPGGTIYNTLVFNGTVVAIDQALRTVTLKSAEGRTKTFHVSPETDLSNVNRGDDVGLRITQAIAIAVEQTNR